ncbi:MAG: sulfurtransferase [Polaromonas sp.]|nr:sulfurtransferase [Polaromonas sp.]
MPTLNIAAYKFVTLNDLPALQAAVLQALHDRSIKGTVLLAEEGINLFLAGLAEDLHGFLAWLRCDPRFADLQTKESWSAEPPFRKLLVKVKAEIIRMNHPAIKPTADPSGRAPAVDAATLKRWLDTGHDDTGRPVVTLDTRNAFEVDVGTFRNAIDWRIDKFTEFPQALADHRDELTGKTVVSFCTGGIRCEKAAILMREAGVEQVFQLDGGILKYFEESGRAHFDGGCFVFDERRALDPALAPEVEPAPKVAMPPRRGSKKPAAPA